MQTNNRRPKNLLNDQSGFTLMELLIVIAVIGMIAGLVVSNVMSKFDKAKIDTTKIQMRQLGSVLDDYRRVCNQYPSTDQGLDALVKAPTIPPLCKNYEQDGFIKDGKVPRDAWGNEFKYESEGRKYVLTSLGSDNAEGGEENAADIRSDNLE